MQYCFVQEWRAREEKRKEFDRYDKLLFEGVNLMINSILKHKFDVKNIMKSKT